MSVIISVTLYWISDYIRWMDGLINLFFGYFYVLVLQSVSLDLRFRRYKLALCKKMI